MSPAAREQLRERLHSQDNLATAEPLYCVQEEERIYGLDPDYADDSPYVWSDWDEPELVYDSDAALLAEEKVGKLPEVSCLGRVTLNERLYQKVFYATRWKFVCAHFSRDAADQYIAENAHNLTRPRVYVSSQYRCPEWIAVRKSLMEGPSADAPHGAAVAALCARLLSRVNWIVAHDQESGRATLVLAGLPNDGLDLGDQISVVHHLLFPDPPK